MRALEDGGKRIGVTAGIDEFRANGSDQITACAHAVADNHGTAAQHGLIDHNSERIIDRRQDQEIGGGVDCRELRLIDETKKLDARSNAKSGCFGLELRTERTISSENKDSV